MANSRVPDFRPRAVAEVLTPFLARHGFRLICEERGQRVPSVYIAAYRNGEVALRLYTEFRDGIVLSFARVSEVVSSDGAVSWPYGRGLQYWQVLQRRGQKDRTRFNWLQRFMVAESANDRNFRQRLAEICENLERAAPDLLSGDPAALAP